MEIPEQETEFRHYFYVRRRGKKNVMLAQKEMEEEQKASWEKITIEEHMEIYENQGHSRKEAMKLVANDRGMTKRDVYQYLINKSEE